MKYSKLKQICKKCKRYEIIGLCCFVPMFIMLAVLIVARLGDAPISDVVMGAAIIVGVVDIVVSIVFSRLEAKWYRIAEDYVFIKIMEVINEFCIDSSNFELIQETPCRYRVGFRNQMIDYEKLQARLDAEVADMNKITGRAIRVDLI